MCPEDREHIAALSRNSEVMRYLMIWLDSDEQIDEMMNGAVFSGDAQRKAYWFSVIDLSDDSWAGFCLIEISHESETTAEIGYILLDKYWGRGYASEILKALIDYSFTVLGLHRVFGKCDERNGASAKVMEKCGMRREGLLREHVYLRDHWRNSLVFGILESEYRK